jgi:hypothetical protein
MFTGGPFIGLNRRLTLPQSHTVSRTAFFWAITQRAVEISYRRFGTTYLDLNPAEAVGFFGGKHATAVCPMSQIFGM